MARRTRRRREKRLARRALILQIERLLREEFYLTPRGIAHWLNKIHRDLPEFGNRTPQELVDKGRADLVLSVLKDLADKRVQ